MPGPQWRRRQLDFFTNSLWDTLNSSSRSLECRDCFHSVGRNAPLELSACGGSCFVDNSDFDRMNSHIQPFTMFYSRLLLGTTTVRVGERLINKNVSLCGGGRRLVDGCLLKCPLTYFCCEGLRPAGVVCDRVWPSSGRKKTSEPLENKCAQMLARFFCQ